MFKYKISYLVEIGSMTVVEKIFECVAWSAYGAWKRFLKVTADESHYTSLDKLNSYWFMKKDIRYVRSQKIRVKNIG